MKSVSFLKGVMSPYGDLYSAFLGRHVIKMYARIVSY
jgi:hypothetical protein